MVWLSTAHIKLALPCKKLGPRVIGPYPVLEVVTPVAMRLQLPVSFKIHPVFHVSLLRPVHPDRFPYRGFASAPDPVVLDDVEEYVVNCILDSRFHYGRLQYLVGWRGYGPEENTWVRASEVKAPALVSAFHRLHPAKPSASTTPPPRRRLVHPALGSRPRGRPRLVPLSQPASSSSSLLDSSLARGPSSSAFPPRPRGRPRKTPVLSSSVDSSTVPQLPVPRRPRGRPRKHPPTVPPSSPVLPVVGPSPTVGVDSRPLVARSVDTAAPRPSRPRGRPRKHPLVAGPPLGSGPPV